MTPPTLNTQTITVTDPLGKNTVYTYATGALVQIDRRARRRRPRTGTTPPTRAATITDPDGDTSYMTYDAHNNVTSTTTCAAVGNCQTSYASYYENLSSPLDPRNDKPTDSRDARSSSPSDPTYDTVTTYTPTGPDRDQDHAADRRLPVRLHDHQRLHRGTEVRRRRRHRTARACWPRSPHPAAA